MTRLFFALLISIFSVQFSLASDEFTPDDYTDPSWSKVADEARFLSKEAARQFHLQQVETGIRPMCLTTGERCESMYDVCCSDGQYCGVGSICR